MNVSGDLAESGVKIDQPDDGVTIRGTAFCVTRHRRSGTACLSTHACVTTLGVDGLSEHPSGVDADEQVGVGSSRRSPVCERSGADHRLNGLGRSFLRRKTACPEVFTGQNAECIGAPRVATRSISAITTRAESREPRAESREPRGVVVGLATG